MGVDTANHSHTGESDSALHDIAVPTPICIFHFRKNAETQKHLWLANPRALL